MIKTLKSLLIVATAVFLAGCTKTIDAEMTQQKTGADGAAYVKLENPYSLTVMQEALDALRSQGYDVPKTITANRLYVTLTPTDTAGIAALKAQDLDLYEYPLDYEINNYAAFDRDFNDGTLKLYTTVEVGYKAPAGVTMKVIEECYIPEDTPGTKGSVNSYDNALERMAITLVGDTPLPETKGDGRNYPHGTITYTNNGRDIYKDTDTKESVRGIKVKLNYSVKTRQVYTNHKGYWECPEMMNATPKVTVEMTSAEGFKIYDGINIFTPASFVLQNKWKNEETNIDYGHKGWYWCIISNAGYQWYEYCKETSINTPPSGLEVQCFKGDRNSTYYWGTVPMTNHINPILALICPDIIFNLGPFANDGYYFNLYYGAIHEFAHASHFAKVGKTYWKNVTSTYALGGFGYGSSKSKNANFVNVVESWGYSIENYMEMQVRRISGNYANGQFTDKVWLDVGFTTALLQNNIVTCKELFDCYTSSTKTMQQLRDNLLNRYPDRKQKIEYLWSTTH